ncbi:YciI family protein [Chitinophaga solisilvae]|uniref:Uncharacterized protein n=1 Tax=Chitinophaga solisilvae TaxID=1233460 RepID=A0A433WLJ4_9BACT|nr:YciI family protein [Chitinophaga solisilvae]NSL90626.1 hypothetical protein [Chitinophaga solisilvae]
MTSKVVPALLLLGFLVVVIVSFHPPMKNAALSVLQSRKNTAPQHIKCYWMVLLKKGLHRDQPAAEAEKIQQDHMKNINYLAKSGKLILAGPFGNEGELRGIFILNCKDSLEAANLAAEDPAVKAGRLNFEILPWWTEKNCLFN